MGRKSLRRRNGFVSLIACVILVLIVAVMPIVASAATNYPVVTDDYGVIESSDISSIEKSASTLSTYDLAVYVGYDANSGKAVIDSVTEEQYGKIFGDNGRGILIVVIFDEEEYSVNIGFGKGVTITEKQRDALAAMVFDSYWNYDSDSTWLAGAAKDVATYMANVEKEEGGANKTPVTTPVIQEKPVKTYEGWKKATTIFSFIAVAGIITSGALIYARTLLEEKRNIEESEIRGFESTKVSTGDQIRSYENGTEEYTDWAALARRAHPEIDDEIKKVTG